MNEISHRKFLQETVAVPYINIPTATASDPIFNTTTTTMNEISHCSKKLLQKTNVPSAVNEISHYSRKFLQEAVAVPYRNVPTASDPIFNTTTTTMNEISHCSKKLLQKTNVPSAVNEISHYSRKFLQEAVAAPYRNVPTASDPILNTTTPFKPFNSSMALTVIVLLTALFFMAFFSIYLRRLSTSSPSLPRQPLASGTPSSTRSKGLNPSTVRSIPLLPYSRSANYSIDCVVCLTEFQIKEMVKIIPHCAHVFHPSCIDTWLSSHVTCPVCRSPVVSA